MEYKFLCLCKDGKLNELKEIYNSYNINIHVCYDEAFRWSCYYGHLNVAQWLYSLGGVNIHANNEDAFKWSCGNGHINVAQWLYSLGGVDIHNTYNFAFICSCGYSHLNIVQWLLSIDKFNNELVDNNLPAVLYDYAFNLGYLPTNKMIPLYTEYKNKIMKQLKDIENISIFEIDGLVNIIMTYI